MTEAELWKDIKGYEGYYQISSHGNVMSKDRVVIKKNGVRERLQGHNVMLRDRNGYLQVELSKNSNRKTFKVHRLVASAFIPNKYKKPCVDHIDGNKHNNRKTNLRWCTHLENNTFPLAIKHKSEAQKGHKNALGYKHSEESKKRMSLVRGKSVYQLSLTNETLAIYDSITQASRETGIAKQNIHICCNHKNRTAGGYKWSYKI